MAASPRRWISRASAATRCAASRSTIHIGSTSRRCAQQIARDRAIGLKPFLVVGSAGTVDIGAIDDLRRCRCAVPRGTDSGFTSTAPLARSAFSSPELAPRLAGIESADSIAFDFHKWGQVPYDAGFLLVRDGERHRGRVRSAGGLSAPGDARARRRLRLALRSRRRSVARLPRAEDLVHAEDLRHRQARGHHRAHLRAGGLSRGAHPAPSRGSNCWRRSSSISSAFAIAPMTPTGSIARSSSTSRNPGSRRRRPRCSTAGSRSARPSSITAPTLAISMR